METFFISSLEVDEIEVQEFLLRKYSNIEYILNFDFKQGFEFIKKAFEVEVEEKLWQRWLIDSILMNEENFKNFEEYKSMFIKGKGNENNAENLTLDQIEDKVKSIIDLTL